MDQLTVATETRTAAFANFHATMAINFMVIARRYARRMYPAVDMVLGQQGNNIVKVYATMRHCATFLYKIFIWLFLAVNHCVREIATPINGSKHCTNGNNIESVCEFECASSFRLIGSRYVTCEKGNFNRFPTWSGESPICESNFKICHRRGVGPSKRSLIKTKGSLMRIMPQ